MSNLNATLRGDKCINKNHWLHGVEFYFYEVVWNDIKMFHTSQILCLPIYNCKCYRQVSLLHVPFQEFMND